VRKHAIRGDEPALVAGSPTLNKSTADLFGASVSLDEEIPMSLDANVDFGAMFRNDDRAYGVDAGSVIFNEGDPGDCLYVILDGEVDIRVHEHQVWRLKAGEIFGEMALVEARSRSAQAVARTACRLVAVDERRFLFLVAQTPYFALGLLRLLASRLRAMDETVS